MLLLLRLLLLLLLWLRLLRLVSWLCRRGRLIGLERICSHQWQLQHEHIKPHPQLINQKHFNAAASLIAAATDDLTQLP